MMKDRLDLKDLDLPEGPGDVDFLWTLRSQVTMPALAMIQSLFGKSLDDEAGALLIQVEDKLTAMDNALKRLYEEAPPHNEKISGKGRGISMKEQNKEAPGRVYDAFGQFKWAFFRLQLIPKMCFDGLLDDNPEGIDILTNMVKHGLEPLKAGMKDLTDAYSDLKAPEAQPESKTSEAQE